MLKVLLIDAQPLLTIKKLCLEKDFANTLQAFLSCRLNPLDKNPWFQPIGVKKVLGRIFGELIVSTLRHYFITSVGPFQLCLGLESGCETAVHAIYKVYKEKHTDAVLLVDAANAFNSVNRKGFLHNNNVVCPSISIYLKKCFTFTISFIYHPRGRKKILWGNNARWSCYSANVPFISYATHANGIKNNQHKKQIMTLKW